MQAHGWSVLQFFSIVVAVSKYLRSLLAGLGDHGFKFGFGSSLMARANIKCEMSNNPLLNYRCCELAVRPSWRLLSVAHL